MSFEFRSIRHVNGMCRDVIDGGNAVVAKRREVRPLAEQTAIGRERGQRDAPRQQVRELLQERAVFSPGNGGISPGAGDFSSSTREIILRCKARLNWP